MELLERRGQNHTEFACHILQVYANFIWQWCYVKLKSNDNAEVGDGPVRESNFIPAICPNQQYAYRTRRKRRDVA